MTDEPTLTANMHEVFRRGAAGLFMLEAGDWLRGQLPPLGLNASEIANNLGIHESSVSRLFVYDHGLAFENAVNIVLVLDRYGRARRVEVGWAKLLTPADSLIRSGYRTALRYASWLRLVVGRDLLDVDLPVEDLAYLAAVAQDEEAMDFIEGRQAAKLGAWLKADNGHRARFRARVVASLGFPHAQRSPDYLQKLVSRDWSTTARAASIVLAPKPEAFMNRDEARKAAQEWRNHDPSDLDVVTLFLLAREHEATVQKILRAPDTAGRDLDDLSRTLATDLAAVALPGDHAGSVTSRKLLDLLRRWWSAWHDFQYAFRTNPGSDIHPVWRPLP